MPTVCVFLYDAFASSTFGGNVAGVVLAGDCRVDDRWLQRIARELAAPTTGFVWRVAPEEFRVRFFTPYQEIDMCGHVVVGVASALVDEGWIDPNHLSTAITFHTLAGPIPVSIDSNGSRPEITMTQRTPVHETVAIESFEIVRSLGLNNSDLHPSLPIEIVSTALRHLIVPVGGINALGRIRPDYAAVASLCRQTQCDTMPIVAFTNREGIPNWRLRDLCPAIGNEEEPASGTTNGALGCYALAHGIVTASDGTFLELVGEQGVEQHRPSTVRVRLELRENAVSRIMVSGHAYRSLRGEVQFS